MTGPLGDPTQARSVLRIRPFRRLWIALSLSSLGDWLSLLALMSLAAILTADQRPLVQYFAVSGVVVLKLAPYILFGPFAGWLADRFDRRLILVGGDVLRGLLYISIPIVGDILWLLIANFLAECVALFWAPAKDATVPNLVPKHKLEQANQLSLFTTYGTAPVAAALFTVLATISSVVAHAVPGLDPQAMATSDIALYINGVTFFVSAVVIWTLAIPKTGAPTQPESLWRAIWSGWHYAVSTPLVRGLLLGMLGAFAAGGAVVGVARPFVETLGAGNAGFGLVFGAVFVGMAAGMFLGPRVLADFDRRRLFGLGIAFAGVSLIVIGLVPEFVLATLLAGFVGCGAGIAWVIGLTLIGSEVDDEIRGRTFAFLHATARIVLLGSVAVAPLIAAAIGQRQFVLSDLRYDFHGTAGVLLVSGVVSLVIAFVSYRNLVGDSETTLWQEIVKVFVPAADRKKGAPEQFPGTFIALEGGEGAGKSTQARQLAIWLREEGFDVVTTREPGATKVGLRLRAMLLDQGQVGVSPRAESLLYAADRAEHISTVIQPALRRGAIVISDRYVDSTLAYQGAGRQLDTEGITEINDWATHGIMPDLTVLLDIPAGAGMERHGRPADRMESEPTEFHDRVRQAFLGLAAQAPDRYLVMDARESADDITRAIQRRVRPLLPDPVPQSAEAITGTMPVIKDVQG
ncbi:dTMP kinase [Spiractinospora alimapuensis]|uniref:dTMP kinase n=1 Tax=Spiractinospora alimapuensis TaxID=2820884 RepID=UPI001EEA679F|nr:dTMP kinase [Spiractinospora alimapuensis]QVQ50943.1 dTMP kinase [Spiractinospora alimapuensis]